MVHSISLGIARGLSVFYYLFIYFFETLLTRPAFIRSKSTIETPEQYVKSIRLPNKDFRMSSLTLFQCLYC